MEESLLTVHYKITVRFLRRNSTTPETKEITEHGFRDEKGETIIFNESGQEVERFTPDRYQDWVVEAEHRIEP